MTPKRFKGSITQAGSRTVISIPFDPDQVWGPKDRHHIAGSINGCPVRGALESAGSNFFLALGPAWRRDNGIEAGAAVEVEIFPEGPQSDALSPDVTGALEAAPEAQSFFDSLASFYRKNFIRWIESAKRPQTRAARIEEMVKLLKARQRLRG